MTSQLTVHAIRWSGGWELHLDDDNCTQVRTLDQADRQVRDYLDTLDEATSHDDWDITIIPEIGGYDQAMAARAQTRAAIEAQAAAAVASREAVRTLRAQGLTMAECASILGVTRGRVAQLAR
ncbi:antitoxin HicB [Cutibacterium sp. V947]|uniref:antitoxin HicB n=1 Tax=unclassified Cutibacterium TaxID=2649671 RepID=UPI003EDF2F96